MAIVRFSWVFYGALRMPEATDTLNLGDRAPDFELGAANRAERFGLAAALQRGPVILEFLRGTW